MSLIVMKFGGTSVADIKKIKNVANIVSQEAQKNKIIVVVSAMAGVTNKMENYIKDINSNHNLENDYVVRFQY